MRVECGAGVLEVVGSGYGSVGAGPQRGVTRVWAYQPGSGLWEQVDEIIGASDYRIHTIHDVRGKDGDGSIGISGQLTGIDRPRLQQLAIAERHRSPVDGARHADLGAE